VNRQTLWVSFRPSKTIKAVGLKKMYWLELLYTRDIGLNSLNLDIWYPHVMEVT